MSDALVMERSQFLADIIVTAVEGGTGYWATVSGYRYSDREPATTCATLWPQDEPAGTKHEVTLETIERGLRVIREKADICAFMRLEIIAADEACDAGEIDAVDADTIVQAGLFGQIVYG